MTEMIKIIGDIVIIIGLVFMAFGVFGIFRFNDYFSRVLVGGKIDTVGFITVLIGLVLKSGLNFFSLKILIIITFFIITNPIATHAITRSAYLTGYRIKKER